MREGLQGELVDDGVSIARVVVINVYSSGGVRARIEGPISGTISRRTVVEIEVPVMGNRVREWPQERDTNPAPEED